MTNNHYLTEKPGACLLVLLLLSLGCGTRGPGKHGPDDLDRLPRLETVQPKQTRLDVVSELTATVDAFEKVDLCAQVRGVVNKIPKETDIGRVVKEGEELITLAVPDLVAEKQHKVALTEQAEKLKSQAEQNQDVAAKEVIEAGKQV